MRSPTQPSPFGYALGFVTRDGKRRLLLVNKRDRPLALTVPGTSGGGQDVVDQTTGASPASHTRLEGDTITLRGFGVAVVTLP